MKLNIFTLKTRNTLPFSILIRHLTTAKRFYRRTGIISNGNKYEITLDQRKLKTPKGHVFEVDSKPLALAVAAEWDSQTEIIDRSNMHLTALCNTALDNPQNLMKLDMVNHIVRCLEMDTILFHSSEPEELCSLQKKEWDPLVQWFCDHFRVNIVKTQSIESPIVPSETKSLLIRHLCSYNQHAVHGFMYGVDAIKSLILTFAVVERVIDIETAIKLSRLEEVYQTSHWGVVEWSHELSKEDLRARLAAAVLFVHLNSYSVSSRLKGIAQE